MSATVHSVLGVGIPLLRHCAASLCGGGDDLRHLAQVRLLLGRAGSTVGVRLYRIPMTVAYVDSKEIRETSTKH